MSMGQMPTVVGCAVAFLLLSAAMAAALQHHLQMAEQMNDNRKKD
jgi:hypothetical protein